MDMGFKCYSRYAVVKSGLGRGLVVLAASKEAVHLYESS